MVYDNTRLVIVEIETVHDVYFKCITMKLFLMVASGREEVSTFYNQIKGDICMLVEFKTFLSLQC